MIQNKAPGKDVSIEDMKEKFPLTAKTDKSHTSFFEIAGISFGSKLIPVMAGPNMVESEDLIVETAKLTLRLALCPKLLPLELPLRRRYVSSASDSIGASLRCSLTTLNVFDPNRSVVQ